MSKYYVFDTNVLLYDPNSIFNFAGENIFIVIPITVVEEIDRFKKELSDRGRNAREFSRNIEKLRNSGDIIEGVKLDNGCVVSIKMPRKNIDAFCDYCFMGDEGDNRILATALCLKEEIGNNTRIIFLTKDINLRIKAASLGLESRDYEQRDIKSFDEHYKGWREVVVNDSIIDKIYKEHKLSINELDIEEPVSNEFYLINSKANPSKSALACYNNTMEMVELIPPKFKDESFWGISPRNKEQIFAMQLLLNDKIKLVALVGKAGTGKTLLALASGLNQVIDENIYSKLVVSRPIFPMGKDLGFLPGDVEAKLGPWMGPIFDNLDFLVQSGSQDYDFKFLMDKKLVELEPLTYIRGRSISNQYLIVDEAQNLTPHEIKTIITRAGENTKIVLTGDPYQIDTPYLDAGTNGLIYVVEKFKENDIFGTVTLTKGERSQLAELASNIL